MHPTTRNKVISRAQPSRPRPNHGDLLTTGLDTFTVYWHLLSRARAEYSSIDPDLEIDLFERALDITASSQPHDDHSTC